MIKLSVAITKRDDWSREEWRTHYRERHAPLAASVRSLTNRATQYLQNPAVTLEATTAIAEVDAEIIAVTELWCESAAVMVACFNDPDYLRILRPDEQRFCSFDRFCASVGVEFTLLDFPEDSGGKYYAHVPRVKIFAFRTGRPGVARAAFQEYWRTRRAETLIATGHFRAYVRRYVQTHVVDVDLGLPGAVSHGVIDEFTFATMGDAVAYWTAYRTSVSESDADIFVLQENGTWLVFAEEHAVFVAQPTV